MVLRLCDHLVFLYIRFILFNVLNFVFLHIWFLDCAIISFFLKPSSFYSHPFLPNNHFFFDIPFSVWCFQSKFVFFHNMLYICKYPVYFSQFSVDNVRNFILMVFILIIKVHILFNTYLCLSVLITGTSLFSFFFSLMLVFETLISYTTLLKRVLLKNKFLSLKFLLTKKLIFGHKITFVTQIYRLKFLWSLNN